MSKNVLQMKFRESDKTKKKVTRFTSIKKPASNDAITKTESD